MIMFSITLTGPMLVYLAAAGRQEASGEDLFDILRHDGRFVSTVQHLERQGLLSHETPLPQKGTGLVVTNEPRRFKSKGRRFTWEITPKGKAALTLAALDLKEFMEAVNKKVLTTHSYQEIYKEASKP